jgi:hypothetical protein
MGIISTYPVERFLHRADDKRQLAQASVNDTLPTTLPSSSTTAFVNGLHLVAWWLSVVAAGAAAVSWESASSPAAACRTQSQRRSAPRHTYEVW